jgi:hypothetical protein
MKMPNGQIGFDYVQRRIFVVAGSRGGIHHPEKPPQGRLRHAPRPEGLAVFLVSDGITCW